MRKLLLQLNTDAHPAVFDTVLAYDGSADRIICLWQCDTAGWPDNKR